MKYSILFPFILIGVFLSGCITEDLGDCPDDGQLHKITLDLRYEHNMRYTDEFSSIVDSLEVYVHDDLGNFVEKFNFRKSEISGNEVELILPNGEYRITTWVNRSRNYNPTGTAMRPAATMELVRNALRESSYVPEALLHGAASIKLWNRDVRTTIKLIKDTNTIHVTCNFNKVLGTNVTTEARITGQNSIYDFDNNPVREPNALTYYIPTILNTTYAAQSDYSRFTVMRLLSDDDLTLTITLKTPGSPDEVLQNRLLTQMLMSYPGYNSNEMLDRQDVYHLTFEFEYNNADSTWMVVGIWIDNWDLIGNETGI